MTTSQRRFLVVIILVLSSRASFAQQSPASPPTTQQKELQSEPVQVQQQLERVANNLVELKKDIVSLKEQSWMRDWIPLLAALLAAVVAIYSLRSNMNMAERTLRDRAREEERKAIREKIDKFYGPYETLRGKSKALYNELFLPRRTAAELKDFADEQGRYRTVIALMKGWEFKGVDKAVLEEIVDIGEKTAKLIHTEMGLVDDADLRGVLSMATAHYWVIYNLFHGNLPGVGEEFAKLVFPRELDKKIEGKLASLNKRLVELQG